MISRTSNIKIIQKVFVYLLPAMFDLEATHYLLSVFKIQRNPWQMIVDLRNNPPRSQLAPSRIKLREVQTTQIVHKKRHVLTIRYFQTSLKIAIFTLWSLRFESNHETEREGKALKKKPLRSLETVAIFVFLIHCLLYTSPSPRDQRGSRMPSSA